MKTSPLVLAISIALAACATQEPPKPAPPAPAPAPAPKPQAAPELKPVAKPEPKPEPKKPAVVNLSSRERFEFNKATLTTAAQRRLDAQVGARLKDVGEVRYINVHGHAEPLRPDPHKPPPTGKGAAN